MNLSDDALRAAAGDVRKAIWDSLPAPEECQHTFSPQFERKMQRLIRRQKTGNRLLRRIAAVFLALLAGSGIWLMANTEARAAFFHWVQTVHENIIVYRFFGSAPAEQNMAGCRPAWLPEGYVETDQIDMDWLVVEYRNEENDVIYFQCCPMDESIQVALIPNGEISSEEVSVNGMYGMYYQPENTNESSDLFWFDEENRISFQLSGFLDKSTLIQIAESVGIVNMTN